MLLLMHLNQAPLNLTTGINILIFSNYLQRLLGVDCIPGTVKVQSIIVDLTICKYFQFNSITFYVFIKFLSTNIIIFVVSEAWLWQAFINLL